MCFVVQKTSEPFYTGGKVQPGPVLDSHAVRMGCSSGSQPVLCPDFIHAKRLSVLHASHSLLNFLHIEAVLRVASASAVGGFQSASKCSFHLPLFNRYRVPQFGRNYHSRSAFASTQYQSDCQLPVTDG
ncbi:unnamed protein product [Darwinula stevensoni]|uniref:Uncharacterized protein n=1 Tax=Darwinula stevensoni TaxID=69355 RepID=A0A7R8X7D4_9CRUS|nr:unnamed protein product [Darwinula stevensoni]CAG0882195.1 unnamed protein product [Darwinula stevensoni]